MIWKKGLWYHQPFRTGILCFILLVSLQCNAQKAPATGEYDLSKPDMVIELPHSVSQISGIIYQQDNSVLAIDDDHGLLYKIPLTEDPKIQNWEFGKPHDYEDVAVVNNTVYVLNSKGAIVQFPLSFPVKDAKEKELSLKGHNEFEILYPDASQSHLVMMCKDCKEDKKSETSAYHYDINKQAFDDKPFFVLDRKDIEEVLGNDIGKFKPSAAALQPGTGNLFIVSSINSIIVVLNKDLKVVAVYPLPHKLFKQPEGITFTPTGDMIISNEFAHHGKANLLIFKKR